MFVSCLIGHVLIKNSNPRDYNENQDARPFDARLRGPTRPIELEIDPETGMKNYIANGKGDWATSAAFVKYSIERSIHHGRLYTNGHGFFKGKDEDLAEALRLLGQALHTLEDFGAHTNYVELALRELGYHNVFPHVGTATGINLRGKHVFPLVTGTFGTVDFYHSVIGEATDHFTQSEVNEMDNALGTAQTAAQSSNPLTSLVKLLSKVPGTKDLCNEAEQLQNASRAQAQSNSQGGQQWGGQGAWRGADNYSSSRGLGDWDNRAPQPDWGAPQSVYPHQPQGYDTNSWNQPSQNYNQPPQSDWNQHQPQFNQQSQPQSFNMQDPWQQQHHANVNPQQTPAVPQQQPGSAPAGIPGMPNFDPAKTVQQIYPILAFRDKVVRSISAIIEKIPGLEALVDRITETLTVFILSLLAPFVRPVIKGISEALQAGSSEVIDSSGRHQYEVWTNPHSSDPTHSMLSKDHFSNMLNEPAGYVAAAIVKFIAPRVLYAWEHPDVPVQQVLGDIEGIFHHPAIRNEHNECHRNMFEAVRTWAQGHPDRGHSLNDVLSSEGVRAGRNHKAGVNDGHNHNPAPQFSTGHTGVQSGYGGFQQQQQRPQQSNSPLGMVGGLLGSLTGQGQGHGQQQTQSGGLGGMLNSFTGQSQSQGYGQQQHQSGGLGGMLNSFTGQGQSHGQSHGQQSSGLGGMLNMANKLPIPGLQGNIGKYSKFLPGGSGGGGSNRGVDNDGFGPEEVGGNTQMHQAMGQADYAGAREPSPRPMQPPSGYETYGQGQSGGYGGEGYQSGQSHGYQAGPGDNYYRQ